MRVVQSENILLRFFRRGHADDGCSCNHRAVPPSEKLVWKRRRQTDGNYVSTQCVNCVDLARSPRMFYITSSDKKWNKKPQKNIWIENLTNFFNFVSNNLSEPMICICYENVSLYHCQRIKWPSQSSHYFPKCNAGSFSIQWSIYFRTEIHMHFLQCFTDGKPVIKCEIKSNMVDSSARLIFNCSYLFSWDVACGFPTRPAGK